MNIESIIREEFDRVQALAEEMFQAYDHHRVPTLEFFEKGSTAGWAMYKDWKVRINTHIASQNLEVMKDTISHEIAHMVCFATGLGKGHNAGWKRVHKMLGGNSKRTYCAKSAGITILRARRTRQFEYVMGSDTFWIGSTQHKRLQANDGYHLTVKATGLRIPIDTFTGKSRLKP